MPQTSHSTLYVLALGSNRPVSALLTPKTILAEATRQIAAGVGTVLAMAPLITTPPIGPSRRVFANGAVLLETSLAPDILLNRLQQIERSMGRRRHRRWGARSLDIDIILWSGGCWGTRALRLPHPAFRDRDFVLMPLLKIAPDWRDPCSGRTVRQLLAGLRKSKPANG